MGETRFSIRQGTPADAPLIAAQRLGMFRDMGYTDDAALQTASAAFDAWLADKLRKNEYFSWFALNAAGEAVAGVGLWLQNDMLPGPLDSSGRRAYVLNVYTHPDYRRLGLARQLMTVLLDWCRTQGLVTVFLHASETGRPLYESLGFRQTNEMRLRFPKAD